jgi:dihydrofolate synthase/folylpolyglutamate synthase
MEMVRMTRTAMTGEYQAVQDYLYSLKACGVKFGIDRMRLVVREIGHPERSRPCVHVAGTNGKGSVAAMLESVLREAGWRTGLYTSPHLVRLGERVQVNRVPLSEKEIIAYVAELGPVAERLAESGGPGDRPSFFEFMTAMAFLQFERKRCDMNIIEVGLGGRLDATNVVSPEVSVITSISLDHCELLGSTVEAIAAEKAGIIKQGCPVVLGRMPPEAVRTIRRIADEHGSPVIFVEDEFGSDLRGYPETNLEGDCQRWNAATAVLALRRLGSGWKLTDDLISGGLRRVDWPGRWQRTRVGGRLLILDASHNPEGAHVLDSNLARLRAETGRRPVVVTGALGAPRAQALLAAVARHAGEIWFVVPKQARACGYEELERLTPGSFRGRVVRSTVEALFPEPEVCTAGGPEDSIVVTGSIYVLGEVLARIEPGRGAGEGRLQDF